MVTCLGPGITARLIAHFGMIRVALNDFHPLARAADSSSRMPAFRPDLREYFLPLHGKRGSAPIAGDRLAG